MSTVTPIIDSVDDLWPSEGVPDDVLGGHEVLLDAFNTDVRPACAEARVALGGAEHPIKSLRESGYAARMATQRESEQELTR